MADSDDHSDSDYEPDEQMESDDDGEDTFGAEGQLTRGPDVFSSVKIATDTCLHAYATGRMRGAEDQSLPWPPLMLLVIKYLNNRYPRKELVTERNIAMLELLLRVPIQLRIRRGQSDTIDLNDPRSLDFTGKAFVEALEIRRDLLEADIIKQEQIR